MSQVTFKAAYYNHDDSHTGFPPDDFTPNVNGDAPSFDFVISRFADGEVASRYGDDIWDMRPYRTAAVGLARLHFTFCEGADREESKWLMFVLLYMQEPKRESYIGVGSGVNYLGAIRKITRYSRERGFSIREILESEKKFQEFVDCNRKNSGLLKNLYRILNVLMSLPSGATGYSIPSSKGADLLRDIINRLPSAKQFPVIPPRLLSVLISDLEHFINEVFCIVSGLSSFIVFVAEGKVRPRRIRPKSVGRGLGQDIKPDFWSACDQFGLVDFFVKYRVTNLVRLKSFISRVQHGCKTLMHIYSGMRSSEVLALKIGAFQGFKYGGNSVYKINGETSKLHGVNKKTSWITSYEVRTGFEVAEAISIAISKGVGLLQEKKPLFPSVNYISSGCGVGLDPKVACLAKTTLKSQEVYNYFDDDKYKIKGLDFDFLERLDPFRDWREDGFEVGSSWRFTSHQFRRTLAFYAMQSSNVSLPSLKRQLKHISRDMTIYYGSSFSDGFVGALDEGFVSTLNSEKAIGDTVAYLDMVEGGDAGLYGCLGMFTEKNRSEIDRFYECEDDRHDLISRFERGEVSYKETPLGACMSVDPCDKRLYRQISACVSCDRAIIKKDRLESVIEAIRIKLAGLQDSCGSNIEARTDAAELEELITYRKKIADGGEDNGWSE